MQGEETRCFFVGQMGVHAMMGGVWDLPHWVFNIVHFLLRILILCHFEAIRIRCYTGAGRTAKAGLLGEPKRVFHLGEEACGIWVQMQGAPQAHSGVLGKFLLGHSHKEAPAYVNRVEWNA